MIIATRTNMSETREETEFLKRKMLSVYLGEIEGKPFKFTKKMNDCGYGIDIILETITDVVAIVRCRECIHNRDNGGDCDRTIILNEYDSTEYRYAGLEYCSYGERREE